MVTHTARSKPRNGFLSRHLNTFIKCVVLLLNYFFVCAALANSGDVTTHPIRLNVPDLAPRPEIGAAPNLSNANSPVHTHLVALSGQQNSYFYNGNKYVALVSWQKGNGLVGYMLIYKPSQQP